MTPWPPLHTHPPVSSPSNPSPRPVPPPPWCCPAWWFTFYPTAGEPVYLHTHTVQEVCTWGVHGAVVWCDGVPRWTAVLHLHSLGTWGNVGAWGGGGPCCLGSALLCTRPNVCGSGGRGVHCLGGALPQAAGYLLFPPGVLAPRNGEQEVCTVSCLGRGQCTGQPRRVCVCARLWAGVGPCSLSCTCGVLPCGLYNVSVWLRHLSAVCPSPLHTHIPMHSLPHSTTPWVQLAAPCTCTHTL